MKALEALDYIEDQCSPLSCIPPEYFETIRKALQAMKWQPIETAPKDALDRFLVGRSNDAGIEAVDVVTRIDDDLFFVVGVGDFQNPTHWMPLPEPPKGEEHE